MVKLSDNQIIVVCFRKEKTVAQKENPNQTG